MKRVMLLLLLAVFLVSMVMAGEVPVIKIGAIFPLTGPAAATGYKLKYAVEVAQEIINGTYPEIGLELAQAAGLPNLGGAKVEFVFADHQANPEIAMSEAERLIRNEGVVALIGCYHSSATREISNGLRG